MTIIHHNGNMMLKHGQSSKIKFPRTPPSPVMASSNALQSHLEGLRFGNPQSPPSEGAYSGYSTPTRYSGSFMPTHSQPAASDARASLQRRFTADSGRIPTLTPIGQPTTQALESVDMSATVSTRSHDFNGKSLTFNFRRTSRYKL